MGKKCLPSGEMREESVVLLGGLYGKLIISFEINTQVKQNYFRELQRKS